MQTFTNTESPFSIEEILGTKADFSEKANALFQFQYHSNPVYRKWVDATGQTANQPMALTKIPFLPISFFKTHQPIASEHEAQVVFTSSGTTGMAVSRHPVVFEDWYRQSFLAAFHLFYGEPEEWAIIGLLPSYLERQGSSLVYMVEHLVQQSNNADSGLYLYDFDGLHQLLKRREAAGQKTWLIGVTYALLDFAEQYPQPLQHTTILETGGMKGRKKEVTRAEVQQVLQRAFQLTTVHSEYGMTELLSQAYATGNSIFSCPPWMKVLVRDEDDPLNLHLTGTGALCIIDLANAYSCSFLSTEDIGKVYADGSFEVLGRLDNSDIRGCSLLAL